MSGNTEFQMHGANGAASVSSMHLELGVLSTAYTKEEAEPKFCATGGMGMSGNTEFQMHGANGASGMGSSGSNGLESVQCPNGLVCYSWEKCCPMPSPKT